VISLVFYVAFRDSSYLWYALYVLSFILLMVFDDTRWLFSSTLGRIHILRYIAPHFIMLVLVLAIQFTRTFLSVKTWGRWIDRIYILLMLLSVVIVVLHSLIHLTSIPYSAIRILSYVAFSVAPIVFIASGIYGWMRGHRYAIFYTAAWLILTAAIVFTVFVQWADVDVMSSPILRAAMGDQMLVNVGAGLEVILLTLGAATRLREQRRSDDLLRSILPSSIVDRMRGQTTRIADTIPSATVVFCDIVAFTELSTRVSGSDLIQNLERVFQMMDDAARNNGIEKIKTIGDAYMAVSGAPVASADHAERAVNFARTVLKNISSIRSTTNEPIQLRVGIHTGPIVAGVMGTWKFGYDIWGETVNIASRLEQAAKPGTILVSQATLQLLNVESTLYEAQSVELKGVGEFQCFTIR